jgi:superfamily II DNA or RNA helicase
LSLLAQWQEEISKFLPNARVGIIQGQKKIDVEDKDIVIAMLQSLARIDYPDILFKDINVTVIDEVHNTSSRGFSKVLFKLCSKYTIGLSATPTRSDGCECVFKWHIGDIVYKSKSERKGKHPILQIIKIDSKEYKETLTENRFTGNQQIQYTTMLNDLVKMEKRNQLIIELIKNLVNNENRKVLILSDRRNHLNELNNL